MLQVPGSRDDHVLGGVGVAEMVAKIAPGQPFDAVLRAQNRPPERMAFPEALREQLVHEIVRRVLDHLDLLEDHLLLALDVALVERRMKDDIREDVDGKRQMLDRAP